MEKYYLSDPGLKCGRLTKQADGNFRNILRPGQGMAAGIREGARGYFSSRP